MSRRVRILAEALVVDPTNRFGVPDGHRDRGRTLAYYRSEFGGSLTGTIDTPFGGPRVISLESFGDLPPDTFIDVRFVVPWAGMDFPQDYSDAVVVAEYEVPDDAVPPSG